MVKRDREGRGPTPESRRGAVAGGEASGRGQIRVTVPADRGKANEAPLTVTLLADHLGVSTRQLTRESGFTSRKKRFRLRAAGQGGGGVSRSARERRSLSGTGTPPPTDRTDRGRT